LTIPKTTIGWPSTSFTVSENKHTAARTWFCLFNGLPLGMLELKNAADEKRNDLVSIRTSFQTYKAELVTLFAYNALLVVSDGVEARIGTLTAGREWFKPWRTIEGQNSLRRRMPELQVMIERGVRQATLLNLVRDFHSLRGRGEGAARPRRWLGIISSTRSSRCGRDPQGGRSTDCPRGFRAGGRYEAGARPEGSLETGASASSGTPRAQARV